MDPREAAVALELLGVSRCVPCHYGTFPLLHGTPEELRELAPGVEILEPGARRDGRGLRERWFGATKQRVPQLAVEGEIEFPAEPLVLDELDDASCAPRTTRARPSSFARTPRRRCWPRLPARK